MRRRIQHTTRGWLTRLGIAGAVALICTAPTVHAQSVNPYKVELTQPCSARLLGNLTRVSTDALVSCMRALQAAKSRQVGYGRSGSAEVKADASSNVGVNGQPVNVARNASGAESGLSGHCLQGDLQACNRSGTQAEDASHRMPQRRPFLYRTPLVGIAACVLFFFAAVRAIVPLAMAGDWPNIILMVAIMIITVYTPWSLYRRWRASQASESKLFGESNHI